MKIIQRIGIVLAILVLIFFLLIQFDIIGFGVAQFEKKDQIHVVNNSVLETLEHFIGSEEYNKLNGKTIFFNSWATWCGPCIKEIPNLNKLSDSFKSDTNIVFISYCSNAKSTEIDSILKEDKNLSFNFKKIDSKNGLRMSIRKLAYEQNPSSDTDTTTDAVPMNLIIDKSGKIIFQSLSISEKEIPNIIKVLKFK